MKLFKEKVETYKNQMLQDLNRLVRIASVEDMSSVKAGSPFGLGIRQVFDEWETIVREHGLAPIDLDGFAMYCEYGNNQEHIAMIGHLDVVEARNQEGWKTSPFQMIQEDGFIYGRGVNDDKGGMIAALYAMIIIKECGFPLKHNIRIVAGGAEETTWRCMEHYFKKESQPLFGFSPDGNFPIVNAEMGILHLSLQFPIQNNIQVKSHHRANYVCDQLHVIDHDETIFFNGQVALSRHPEKGINAIDSFLEVYHDRNKTLSLLSKFYHSFLKDVTGRKIGIYQNHAEMNDTSVCTCSLTLNDAISELYIDIRYPISTTSEDIVKQIKKISEPYNIHLQVEKDMKPLFVSKNDEYLKSLKNAYEKVTSKPARMLCKGGASYARVLDRGIAYGISFEGEETHPHMPNERINIDSLLLACKVYCETLFSLACETLNRNDDYLPQ